MRLFESAEVKMIFVLFYIKINVLTIHNHNPFKNNKYNKNKRDLQVLHYIIDIDKRGAYVTISAISYRKLNVRMTRDFTLTAL